MEKRHARSLKDPQNVQYDKIPKFLLSISVKLRAILIGLKCYQSVLTFCLPLLVNIHIGIINNIISMMLIPEHDRSHEQILIQGK